VQRIRRASVSLFSRLLISIVGETRYEMGREVEYYVASLILLILF